MKGLQLFAARLLGAVLAMLALAAVSAEREVRVGLPNHGSLVLKVPDGWREEISRRDPAAPPAILVTPESGTDFKMLLMPNWPKEGSKLPDLAAIQEMLATGAKAAGPASVEKTLAVQEVRGPVVAGGYFSATDRAPEKGEYKHVSQGMVRLGAIVVAFQLMDNGDPKVLETALKMVRAMRLA